jgi:hypothetical protein
MKITNCSYECDVKNFSEIYTLGDKTMKKSLIFAVVGFVTAMCLPFSPASADDQLITVPDGGFDDHVLSVGDWVYIGDGPYAETSDYTGPWQSAGGDAYIDNGYWAADVDLPALSGDNKLYGFEEIEDYVYQILDEKFVEGVTYTLSVWVGEAWEGYDDNWSLYFTGDDYTDELASISGNGPVGEWGQATLVYTATAADAGKRIGIKMKGDAFVTFEDVTLYGPPKTRDPNPANGALVMDTWVNLSWTPANFAVTNDVYIGDNFDDVNNGAESTFQGNQTDTFIVAGFPGFPFPDGLVNGETYYWRIDGINDTNPNSPLKGDVWSFTIVPKTAYDPDPPDGAGFVDPNATFSWTGGYGAKLHTVYIGTNFDDVNNAAGGAPQGAATYSPGPLESEKVYYWRVDEFDAIETHKGDIWSFTTPGAVGNPQPANGIADVSKIAILGWTPADNAASSELYFGTDADAVKNATTASPEYIGTRALGSESYDPGKLAWDAPYYWRVDAVYPAETVKGLLWSFSTADFIGVDDFESYNDIDPPDDASNRIFDVWIDGFGTATNGALVGNDLPPYAEQLIVHGGVQSMPYRYDNANKTSEATMTLVYPRDWTEEGVTKLSLWFRGGSTNAADRMFVALNGGAPVYHDDPAVTQTGSWTEWVIDLTAFGVDLMNVDTITIGVGTKGSPTADGGTGTMYFDDIRLII